MSQRIDFSYIVRIIQRRFYLFAIPFLLLAAAGSAIVFALPAIYTADAKILVETQQIPDDLVKSTITDLASERLQVIQQRVMTRDNLLGLVAKFRLFENKKNLSKSEIVDLMRDRVVFQSVDLQLSSSKRKDDKRTSAFAVEFNYEQPDIVVKVVNELVTFILDEDARARTGRASDTTKFLQRETERLSTDLSTVQTQIAEYKLQNTDTLPEKLAFNMSLLERTEKQINDAQKELLSNDEQQRLLKLESSIKTDSGGQPAIDALSDLKKKLAEAQIIYSVRKKTLAETHPEMRALKETIDVLQQQLQLAVPIEPTQAAATNNILSPDQQLFQEKIETLNLSKKATSDQLGKLQKDAEKLRSVVVKTPETGAALSVLERKETGLQRSLDEMYAKFSQARLGERMEQDQQAERFQVIEQPVVPQSPTKPKRVPLLAAVFAFSIALGAAASGGAEFLDNTIRRSSDIERQLKQHPLVVIPYIRTRFENRRRWLKLLAVALAWLAILGLALAAVHLLYRPLDELFYKILQMLGMPN
jgi:polysaccharide biosynthesis transport protein